MNKLQLKRNLNISREVIAGTTFRDVGARYQLTYTRAQQIFRDTLSRAAKMHTNIENTNKDLWELAFTKRVRQRALYWYKLLDELEKAFKN